MVKEFKPEGTGSPLPDDDELYHALKRFIKRRVQQREQAEDIVQEAFCRLIAAVPPIAAAMRRAWLYRVAKNLLVDSFRQKERFDQLTAKLAPERPIEQYPHDTFIFERNEENEMVLESVNRLDEIHREVLRLKFQEGLTYNEIAIALDKPKTTVAWLLHQSLLQLREQLGVSQEKQEG